MVSGRALLDPGDQLLLLRRGLRLDIEGTAPRHRPLGDDPKPAFHLIEQGGVGGCVVHMVPGAMADGTWDFSVAQAHRQQRLGAVQGLDQCFLVNARIGGELVAAGFREAVVFLPVRLHREGLQPESEHSRWCCYRSAWSSLVRGRPDLSSSCRPSRPRSK
jgi:hypothetical protein